MTRPLAAWLLLALLVPAVPAMADSAGDPDIHLASVHAAVADLDADEILYSKYPERAVPIASITKLMTAIVVIESGEPLDEWLRIVDWHRPPAANAYSRIRIGSELPRGDLLRIALMSSENRAAYTLARHHPGGYEAFVDDMNATASELGMEDTRFVDPSGLSERNVSTVRDLVRLLAAADDHEPIIDASTTSGYRAQFRRPRYSLDYGNTNVLVHRGSWPIEVSKSGYLDAAGRCLVMVTRIGGRRIGMVMLDSLGTRTPIGDAGRIKRWLETGTSGPIAGAALAYERERTTMYEQAERQTAESR